MSGFLYIVREGEWLAKIALQFGITDWHDIYDHDRNAAFRELRPDPSVVKAGDQLWIPKSESVVIDPPQGSEEEQVFTVDPVPPETVDIVMHDIEGNAIANKPYTLQIGAFEVEGTTDGDGRLTEEVDPLLLRVGGGQVIMEGRTLSVMLGHLDPVNTISGIQQRLNNLGYHVGDITGDLDDTTVAAVKRFQAAESIPVDGVASKSFCDKLDDVYGS